MGHIEIDLVVATAVLVGTAAAILSGLVRSVRRVRHGPSPWTAAVLDGALVASVAVVFVATLSPLSALGTTTPGTGDTLLVVRPFETMRGAPTVFAVINLLLLVPTIVLLAQRWRRAGIVRLTFAGVLLSVTVETAQLFHPLRGTNVDDLLLNTAGAFLAAIVGVGVRMLVRRRRRVRGAEKDPRARRLERVR